MSKFPLLVVALTLTFILSCSSDNGGDDSNPIVSSSSIGLSSSQSVSSSSVNASSSSLSSSQNISSSSSSRNSSSSEQANDCEALNNYNMAIEMNLTEPVVVKKNGVVLAKGVNYEVSTTQNSIKVQGLKDYIGSVKHTASNTSGIVVKDGNKVLVENTDYTIIETANSIKIVGINNYSGSVEIEPPCPVITPPTITTTSLPSATVGTAYNATLTATGDTPITWSVQSGSLPNGLTLNASTGVISGTPTAAGTSSNIVIKATNSGGSNQKTFSIVVEAVAPANNIMYHGFTWTSEPSDEELTRVISGEFAADSVTLNPSEVTREGKTITFRGMGVLCIMIPKAIGQIAALKDALNTENLGSIFFARGEITFNGTNYYLYTGKDITIVGLNFNIVMSFQ